MGENVEAMHEFMEAQNIRQGHGLNPEDDEVIETGMSHHS